VVVADIFILGEKSARTCARKIQPSSPPGLERTSLPEDLVWQGEEQPEVVVLLLLLLQKKC